MTLPTLHNPLGVSKRPAGAFLEYIETSGEQWIDTNISSDRTTEIHLQFMTLALNYGDMLVGCTNGSYYMTVQISTSSASFIIMNNVLSRLGYLKCGISKNTLYSIYLLKDDSVNFNDTVYTTLTAREAYDINLPIYIGARNVNGVALVNYLGNGASSQNRYYGVTLNKQYVTVGKFLPYRLVSGEVGMLNTVTNQFHANQGTGEFVAGPAL